ncbi:uncharacterized protein LOC141719974 [Apium graveolens]|uniref:uncharacterized protein LOC141719974 n=1 Tax=Apium graveolens TaxID=4045 RepID=UPI003D797265
MPEHEVSNIGGSFGSTWMTPILAYIKEGMLPNDKNEARRLKCKLVSDNGKQFDNKEMREFCEQMGIQKSFSEAKLEEKNGTWPEELPQVSWSYNTTPRTTTGETPFPMVYGCEAMVPIEVGAGSFRRDNYDSGEIEVNHRLYLDMIEETREDAQIRIAVYQ